MSSARACVQNAVMAVNLAHYLFDSFDSNLFILSWHADDSTMVGDVDNDAAAFWASHTQTMLQGSTLTCSEGM